MTRQRWRKAALIVGGWTLVALFLFSKNLVARMLRNDPSPWFDILLAWLIGSYASAALDPAILWLGDRYPFGRGTWAAPLAIHLVGSAFAVAQLWLEAVVTVWLGVLSFPVAQSVRTYFPVLLALGFHSGAVCYWLIIGLQALWRFHESSRRHERDALELMARASALETQVVQARLGALKMQLQPHFLFNTLNAVVSLVQARRGREAEDTLAHLSDLLRWVLDDSEHQEVPLSRELEYARLYLAVETVRFADRLHVDMRIAPDTLDAAVPHLCLQPIVENAIRHGIEAERLGRRAGDQRPPGRRHVGSSSRTTDLGLRGVRLPVGIGLANTRLRLAELYGDRAALTLANALDGGAIVTLTLPFRECEEPVTPLRAGALPGEVAAR